MPEYKKKLFYNASAEIHKRAKELRKRMTEAEKILWQQIRNRKILDFKFRRQHPIATFIADFYCHELKLVVELDGKIHDLKSNKEYDINRTIQLEKLGIKVLRFKNEEILNNINLSLNKLKSICTERQTKISTSPKSFP